MSLAPYDPRAVCNALLDEAAKFGRPVSNLALQKLLYFAHGLYLIETGCPLVLGYFEAWQHGPVHPSAYAAFKLAKDQPITFRAQRQDPLSGQRHDLLEVTDEAALDRVRRVTRHYGPLSAGRLVALSHAKHAPWHYVVQSAKYAMVFGLRIPDNVIVERFRHHKVTIGSDPPQGDPVEDTPFA